MSENPDRETSLLVAREGDLVWLTLDDSARANALSPRLIGELTAVYERDWRAEGVRAVLLRGAGKHFSAGADLEHLQSLRDAGEEENRRDSERLRKLFEAVLRQEALTVALVQGACVAGGCGLATAHDFVTRRPRRAVSKFPTTSNSSSPRPWARYFRPSMFR